MRSSILCVALIVLAACGGAGSTDTAATRYNFAVVDGRNQASTAGTSTLAKPITSQLTRDPQGKFATRVFDLLAPKLAYAQGVSLAGDPVAGAIVCGRVAPVGEPQVVPLCAFTLADGKAANVVEPGTKAGTYNVLFTAQVQSQEPVKDSTTVIVAAGPATGAGGGQCATDQPGCYLVAVDDVLDLHITFTRAWDQFNNTVDLTTVTPGYAIALRTDPKPVAPQGTGWAVTIDKQWMGQQVFLYVFIGTNAVLTWPLAVK